MRKHACLIILLSTFCGSAWATTVTTSAHVEITDLGNNIVTAQGTSTVTATNVDPQHFNKSLRILGRLYKEFNCKTVNSCCSSQVDFCNSSKVLTKEGQSLSCSTSRTGTCSDYWDITADGKIDLNPTPPSLVSKSTNTCEQADCDPTCEECVE